MNQFILSILLLLGTAIAAQPSVCIDSVQLIDYCDDFKQHPDIYAADLVPEESYATYYIDQINYYTNRFRFKPKKNADWNIRVWSCSGVYANGVVYDWVGSDEAITYRKFTFNQERRLKKRRVAKETYFSNVKDSISQWVFEQSVMDFPQQPYWEYDCPISEDLNIYVIEVFRKGEYRFILYKNPQFYADEGSCIDQLFLDYIVFLSMQDNDGFYYQRNNQWKLLLRRFD